MKQDFGPFELRQKIGSGGMASVYLGVQKSLDRQVVLKVLYPHLAEDEKLVARFEREARAAATMRHENIVQVIDCGRFEDLSYIAMEFVEGMDLKKWLESHGPPPLEMALLMLRDVLRGVEHAHSHRIIHRDIKPANIMLTPEGAIKIMDFGLARRGEESTQVTVVGTVMGTVAYMSPEQATGEAVDERADIFSCGVVGYELLGGRRPFEGESYSAVLRAVLTIDPPSLESLNPLVPEAVVTLIHRMLHKDVSKRYPHIQQVREDLETVIEGLGLHRARDLLRDYAKDPVETAARLRKKHLSRHLDQATYYENLGRGKIQDAIREYRCVLYLDPDNKAAQQQLKKLERELIAAPAEGGPADSDRTLIMEPGQVQPAPGPAAAAAAPATPVAAATRPASPDESLESLEPPPGVLIPIASSAPPAPSPAAPRATPAASPASPSGAAAKPARPAAAVVKPPAERRPPERPTPAKERAERPTPPPRVQRTVTPTSTQSQRLRAMLMAAAGLLIVLVIAGVVVISRGGGGHGQGDLAANTPPGGTHTHPDVTPDHPAGAGAASANPGGTGVGVVSPPSSSGNVTPPLAAPTNQTTPPEAPPARASLALETSPGDARVRIDGRVQAQRSNATYDNLAPGPHSIIVEKEGYRDARRNVTFKPGEKKRVSLALMGSPAVQAQVTPPAAATATPGAGSGTLVVRATPYASYYVNDELKASNLPTAQIPLKPGVYKVRIVHPEFEAHEWSDVRVENGQRTTLTYDFLSTSTGSVRVTSQGIWASVIVDGQETGKTTPCVLELRRGPHTIELRRQGFTVEGGPRSVTVASGSTMEVGFRMKSGR